MGLLFGAIESFAAAASVKRTQDGSHGGVMTEVSFEAKCPKQMDGERRKAPGTK